MIQDNVLDLEESVESDVGLTGHKAPREAVQRFREMQYGLFVHYGLYSMMSRHEWAMCYERIPATEYRELFDKFCPTGLDVREWISLAKKSGMRYVCLTTRHHEGFALFDSQCSDFTSPKSPLGRDLVREFTDACREAGLGVALYYSVADWGDEGFLAGPRENPEGWENFVSVVHGQLKELMTNYGKIDYLWYDGCPPPHTWGAAEINAEIRRLQPDILINDRCGLEEDVYSAEQHVISDPGRPWECSLTTNKSWGCNSADNDWKTTREIVMCLMTCVHNGGNFLLNVGPHYSGEVPTQAKKLLAEIGEWLEGNGEAVFGVEPHPLNFADQKLSTGRGQTVYVPLHFYYGPQTVIAGIGSRVAEVYELVSGRPVDFVQREDRLLLVGLSAEPADKLLPIVAIEFSEVPRGVPSTMVGNARY